MLSHLVTIPQLSPARKIFAFRKIFVFTFPRAVSSGLRLSGCAGDRGDLLLGTACWDSRFSIFCFRPWFVFRVFAGDFPINFLSGLLSPLCRGHTEMLAKYEADDFLKKNHVIPELKLSFKALGSSHRINRQLLHFLGRRDLNFW